LKYQKSARVDVQKVCLKSDDLQEWRNAQPKWFGRYVL
jgi:hypothetical protein